jgi:hypothetical protein
LQTGYAISVTFERLDGAPSVLPVVPNLRLVSIKMARRGKPPRSAYLPPVPIHGFPAASLGLRFRFRRETAALAIPAIIRRLGLSFPCRQQSLCVGPRDRVIQLLYPSVGIVLCQLASSRVIPQLLPFQERQPPATLGAFPIHVLLAHAHPNGVVIGQ